MAALSHYPLQKAVMARLNADTSLNALVKGCFDRPAQGQAYPYVTWQESAASDASVLGSSRTRLRFTLNAWSREGGRRQAEQVVERLYQLLHGAAMAVDGHSLIDMRYLSSEIALLADGWTYVGAIRFEAMMQAS